MGVTSLEVRKAGEEDKKCIQRWADLGYRTARTHITLERAKLGFQDPAQAAFYLTRADNIARIIDYNSPIREETAQSFIDTFGEDHHTIVRRNASQAANVRVHEYDL